MTLNEYAEYIKGKTVSVIGLGVSNMPLIRLLHRLGADIVARDKKTAEQLGGAYAELTALGVRTALGDGYLSDVKEQIIFRSPGLRYDIPELAAAAANGSVISSEMELSFSLCPCKIIGITGSDGKTTTTTVTSLILQKQAELDGSDRKIWLGGNIGTPLCELVLEHNLMEEEGYYISLEISNHQLVDIDKFRPEIATIINLTPDHLETMGSLDAYYKSKTEETTE